MADIVVAPQRIRREVRLEMREKSVLRRFVEGSLIGVDKVRAGVFNRAHNLIQGRGVQQIVVVEKADIVSRHHLQAGVGIAGDAEVLLQLLIADTIVPAHIFFANTLNICMLCIAAVRHAQFPVHIGLGQHGLDHRAQELFRRVVQRHHDTEFDSLGKDMLPLPGKLFLREQRLFCNLRETVSRIDFLHGLLPRDTRPVCPQAVKSFSQNAFVDIGLRGPLHHIQSEARGLRDLPKEGIGDSIKALAEITVLRLKLFDARFLFMDGLLHDSHPFELPLSI